MIAQFVNPDQTIGNIIDGPHITVVEEGQGGWPAFLAMAPTAYTEPDNLDDQRKAALLLIRDMVGAVRRLFITDLPGQEMVYMAKEAEARAYAALSSAPPDLTNFPLLAAEVGITAPTAAELAALWLAMASAWRAVAAQIEPLRLTASASVIAATSEGQINTAIASLSASLAAVTA